ncbi:MAG: DUF1566 domain-containing protein [Leptospiraceae bacterium]|nr:DUF1566 domain-containing protein [Leptospiraceae bacterium]MCP5500768.1 DUF1566 domain-containing protein [Leptospiraceae bacterium]
MKTMRTYGRIRLLKKLSLALFAFIFFTGILYSQDKTPSKDSKPTDTGNSADDSNSSPPETNKPYPKSNLDWDSSEAQEMDWSGASKFCKDKEMRLPNREELKFGYSSKNENLQKKSGNYWTSEYVLNKRANTWFVNSSNGRSYYAPRSSKKLVICVKGSLAGPKEENNKTKFKEAEMDGEFVKVGPYRFSTEVTENLDYFEAKKHCEGKDQVLPGRSELRAAFHSRVDKLRETGGQFVSSSRSFSNSGKIWYVDFDSGYSRASYPYTKFKVRCMKKQEPKELDNGKRPAKEGTSETPSDSTTQPSTKESSSKK